MSNIAIKVEGLGKKYLIKHEQKEPGISHSVFPFLRRGTEGVGSLNPFHKNKKQR